eukprot:12556459-Alexandrium_andersonii.AAC.1
MMRLLSPMGKRPDEDVWAWRSRHTHQIEHSWTSTGLKFWDEQWLTKHWTWSGHIARSSRPLVSSVTMCRSVSWKRCIQAEAYSRRSAWCGHFGRGRYFSWEELIQDYFDVHYDRDSWNAHALVGAHHWNAEAPRF